MEICLDDVAVFSLWGLEMNCRSNFLTHGHVYVNVQKSLHIGFVGICVDIQWYTSNFPFAESREEGDTKRTRDVESGSRMEIYLDDVDAFPFEDSRWIVGVIFIPHGYVNAHKSLHIGFVGICMDIQWFISKFPLQSLEKDGN